MSQTISGSLAYAAPTRDYRSFTVDADKPEWQAVQSPQQQSEAAQRSPATLVSLSPDSSATASAPFSLPASELPRDGVARNGFAFQSVRDAELRRIDAEIRGAEARLRFRDTLAKHFEATRASFEKMAHTPPKAAVALDAKETLEVVKKALSLGYNPLGGRDNYSFGWEGKIYTFMADGSATVHEEGVATSVEQQQAALKSRKELFERATDPMTDVTNERNALLAKRAALLGTTVERIA
jgi:hypothetical protein